MFQSKKNFFILFFDGINHGDTTQSAKEFADELKDIYHDRVECFVVTRYYDTVNYDPIDNILGDIDLTVEKSYKATGQCIYILNNNKKIVWKSCGLMKVELKQWIEALEK